MIATMILMSTLNEGYLILFSGLVIVFTALLILSLFFKYGLPLMLFVYKIITKGPDKKIKDISLTGSNNFTGEEAAVIAAAIHIYLNEQHDFENPILTIKKGGKTYSPWSSKIYGIQNKL